MREFKDDVNLSTVMHEAAHQMSFNTGLLNRQGDGPVWLVEGLACYCEATDNGKWQGLGEVNPGRAGVLAAVLKAKGPFIPLRTLVTSDDWYRKSGNAGVMLLGYSQSWALFRMLMEERPQALRGYLTLLADRRTPDHRLADFGEAFGADLAKLEARYRAYLAEVVQQQERPGK